VVTHGEAHRQSKPAIICFPPFICLLRFSRTSPGGPSPCPHHYSAAFGYYAASVLPSAHWHSRVPPRRVKRRGSSQVPKLCVKGSRSCPLYTGGCGSAQVAMQNHLPSPCLLAQACHPVFRLSTITMPPRGFPCSPGRVCVVSIGLRVWGVSIFRVTPSPLTDGLHTSARAAC